MRRGFQQHEQLITKSSTRLFLPVLPETSNSPYNTVTFKHRKFLKSKTRILYKNRAATILDNAVKIHGNINDLLNEKFKSSDFSRFSERFKRRYFSKCMAQDVLLRRDRWVQCMYFTLHKLNVYSTEQFAKVQLSTDDDRLEAILGTACHAKGWTPYFPEFCFTNGATEYPFEKGGKHKPKVVNPCLEGHAIHPCLDICVSASKEQALQVLDVLEKCQKLNRKQLRQFLVTIDKCDDNEKAAYLQTVEKRNHPIDCYSGENLCPSDLVTLRKLYPHYANVRKLYQILNDLKNMHEMIYDLDAAVTCGDFAYLLKLLAYSPPEKPSKVHNVERPNGIVNRQTMTEKYGKNMVDFYKDLDNLPKTACICCDKLIDEAHKVTISTRRKNLDNAAWQQLLAYLNSNTRTVTRGEPRVESLIGQTICRSCNSELNKNIIPTISIVNGMDTGSQPDCITSLTEFESIFIHLAMCYQTIIKLTPMGANLPYSARMDKLKGFAVHITQPLDSAITELFGNRPNRLVNPDDYIVLHGIPKKDRAVWQRLVSVDKIHAALVWLKQNNPLYYKIEIPKNPIDLLPPDVAPPNSADNAQCDAGKIDNSDTDNYDMSSNASSESLPMFDVNYDMPPGPRQAPASDTISGDLDSSKSYHSTNTCPGLDENLDGASNGAQKNTIKNKNNNRQRQLSGGCHKTRHSEESSAIQNSIEPDMADCVLSHDDLTRLKDMVTQIEKSKFLMMKKLLGFAQRLSVQGNICNGCCLRLRSTRTEFSKRLGSIHSPVNHNSLHLANIAELVAKCKTALDAGHSTDSTSHLNYCTFCQCKPSGTRRMTNKRSKKSQKIARNLKEFENDINELHLKQISYLTKIDELRTDGYLCKSCHVKYDRCFAASDFKLKSKTKLVKTLNQSTLKINHLCRNKLTVFTTVAEKLKESGIKNICAKCNQNLDPKNRALSSLFRDVTLDYSSQCKNECNNEQGAVHDQNLGSIKSQGSRAHSANLLRTLTLNRVYIKNLIQILRLVKQQHACCNTCVDTVEDNLKTYKEILSGKKLSEVKKFEGKHSIKFNLQYVDVEVYRSLLLDSLARFKRVRSEAKCFDCSKQLKDIKTKTSSIDEAVWESFEQSIMYDVESCTSHSQLSKKPKGFIISGGSNAAEDHLEDESDQNCETLNESESEEHEEKKTKNPDDVRKLIENMTEEDFKNLLSHYTVTCLDDLENNPQWLESLYQLLRIDDDPIPLQDPNLDVLCFPEVFPWGIGGQKADQQERQRKVGPLQYERARLLSKRGNIRRNIPYIFSLGQEYERRKITQGVYASLRNVKGLKNMKTKDFVQKLKENDPDIQRRLTRTVRDIPGTAEYWNHQRKKIDAMCVEHGPPTWFTTFSPAEYDWSDLVQYIRDMNSDIPGVKNLSATEVLAKDPVLVSNYIHTRFAALLKFILEADPIGKVSNYFIRTEYQGRGVVHFHCLFWVDGAPIIGKSPDKEVASFIQKYASCKLPDKNQEAELHDMVDKYQRHKCRGYCLRLIKSAGKWKKACRFGFPRSESRLFQLHDVLSCVIGRRKNKMKKRLYDLPRTADETNINDYNPDLLYLWGGNMDIQFLSEDSFSIAEYVTKYVLKSETSHVDSFVCDDTASAFQRSSKFAYECLRSREMSSHEVVDRMLQNNGQLYQVSDEFVFVPTTFPRYRTRCLKKLSELEKQGDTDTDIFAPDFIHDFYPRRPVDNGLDEMSLHDFVKTYERTYNPRARPVIVIKDKAGVEPVARLKQRTLSKRPIVQNYDFDLSKNPEAFYYSYLCLHKPWRQEADIRGPSSTYKEEFFRVLDQYPEMKAKYERKSAIKRMREEMEEKADRAAAQADNDYPAEDPLVEKMDDDDPVIAQALQDYEGVNANSTMKTEEELQTFISTLNSDQRRVYDRVTGSIAHMLDHEEGKCNCDEEKPLLLYCSGYGGTGKTYLIKAIVGYLYVQQHVNNRPCDMVLGAPTGLAADNIKGQTIHAAFNLPVEHGSHPKYSPLNKTSLTQTQAVMKNLSCIIIDEVSMVSNVTLLLIHLRLCEIFRCKSPFGGKCVILFGDLLQLPPVQAQPPFRGISDSLMNKVTGGSKIALNLWREFEFDELTINQRQAGDDNKDWKALLYRVRTGTHNLEDICKLNERCIKIPDTAVGPDQKLDVIIAHYTQLLDSGKTPVCLLPTREMVDRFNSAVLNKLHPDAQLLQAIDRIECRNNRNLKSAERAVARLDHLDDPRNTAGLEKMIHVGEGVKVMLRSNIDVSRGLVNGAIGTIVALNTSKHAGRTTSLSIRFEGTSEPVEIKPVKRKIQIFPGAFLHREQFPICSSYAMTVHKSQGLTLECALIDLGSTIFAPSQSYVAISRVKTLDGLYLINFDPKKIMVNTPSLEEYVRLGSTSGMSPMIRKNIRVKCKQSMKSFSLVPERIWYISAARKKAKSTIDSKLYDSTNGDKKGKKKEKDGTGLWPGNSAKGKKNVGSATDRPKVSKPKAQPVSSKGKTPVGKRKRPSDAVVPSFIPIHVNVSESVDEILRLLSTCPDKATISQLLYNIIDRDVMCNVYLNRVVPFCGEQSDTLIRRMATELQPDPFGVGSSTRQKWLSGDLMNVYGMFLKDLAINLNGPSVYYLSSYARFNYINNCGAYVERYIEDAHRGRQYSAFMNPDYEHEGVLSGLEASGDPFDKDIIINFCNDYSGHWYLVILDRRPGHMSITMYDSGCSVSRDVLQERCSYLVTFLNTFRNHVRTNYHLDWPRLTFRANNFRYIDGLSQRQANAFDCGVFTMLNAECFIRSWDHRIFTQNAIPLVRLSMIQNISTFAILAGIPGLS